MKYIEFQKKVEAMGFKVIFNENGWVQVQNQQGQWLGTVYATVPYDLQLCIQDLFDFWGGEIKRCFLDKLIVQLASTEISNRGRMPIGVVS
ncbi:hypothetical protein HMPREF0501_00474 [Limosilactobacillus coleohominis 101-4-CHN]|uniref:Uncharacterized protein n=1 Tax=Limosilactobacillus coleohominis 101-4-CHN TaxID=575594 RepID=C7XUV8_9LACO|nr:hypothetical protein [Limosilactobacillus coleohominis]EEU31069.1 hypothetical protein HMPREF0501_00474 [Limosilactobacillus coleohominis 101-4-CHN]